MIFISIDDHEVHNLRKICDEIFGEENFIECISWNKRIPKNDKGIGNIHEFILVYAKKGILSHEFVMHKEGLEDIYKLLDKLKKSKTPIPEAEEEVRKLYKKQGYDRGITLYNTLDKDYRLWGKINLSWPNANTFGPRYAVYHPSTGKPVTIPDRGWRWKWETFMEVAKLNKDGEYQNIVTLNDGSLICGRIWFSQDEKMQPSSVTYLDEVHSFLLRSVLSLKSDGGIEIENIFEGKNYFSYPKPTSLVKILLNSPQLHKENNSIILDFFSGSATTAHAVMKLNAEDDGNRRYIMVQLPEKTPEDHEARKAGYETITEIGKERIRRAGEKIKEEFKDKEGIENLDIGFKVFKLNESNFTAWNTNTSDLTQTLSEMKNTIMGSSSSEDAFYEVLLKLGIDISLPVEEIDIKGKKIYSLAGHYVLACFDKNLSLDIIEEMARLSSETETIVVSDDVFKDNLTKLNAEETLKRNHVKFLRVV